MKKVSSKEQCNISKIEPSVLMTIFYVKKELRDKTCNELVETFCRSS